jgi:hypothetical protein
MTGNKFRKVSAQLAVVIVLLNILPVRSIPIILLEGQVHVAPSGGVPRALPSL